VTVEQGCVAVLDRNGMGKTTLLRCIMGLTPPRSGGIRWRDKDITGLKPFTIASMGIGYVPQGRRLFPSLSVDEHLTLTYRKTALASAWTPQRVYDLFPELADRRKLSGTRLSGGEQQMLAIGRALGVTAKKVEVKVDCGRRKLGLLILAWALMRWPRARSYPRAYPTE
jgi:branched-chain amino acid transport system ATP-binding protein